MRMEPSALLLTPRRHSCRLPPHPLLTSTSCKTPRCTSACKMATRVTARRRWSTLYTRHNQSYLQRDLDKRVWEDHLDRILPRDRKHLSKGRTPAFQVPLTVALSSKERHYTRLHFNTRAVMPASPHRCRTNSSIHRPYPSACQPCHPPRSHPLSRTLALRHLLRIRTMEVESIPLRMEHHHTCRVCRMVAAQTKLSIHRLPRIMQCPLHLNSGRTPRFSINNTRRNNSSGCMKYDSGS